ncbi:MAG: hypothetical protein MUO76_10330 [Anaerolineaceae bacterium]|nr:hypothetical protein [Anaerolineaceae bacterium]
MKHFRFHEYIHSVKRLPLFVFLILLIFSETNCTGVSTQQPAAEAATPVAIVEINHTATISLQPSLITSLPATSTFLPFFTSPTSTPPLPTLTASQTSTLTLEPTITETPTEGPSPTFTRLPSATPTITKTARAPEALIRITRPGLYSKLLSPIQIEAMITKGDDGYVYIELLGEDNRIITSDALDYRRSTYSRFLIVPVIEFEISGVAETARLVLSVRDYYGRMIAVSSVDLILLSLGRNEISPSISMDEPFLIKHPYKNQVLNGGKFVVSGLASPINESPLIIELINEFGEIVSTVQVQLPLATGGVSHIPFAVDVPYEVVESTPVRLTIRQESTGRIPGTVALTSHTIFIEP